jgi:hypothetical protein
MNLSDEQIKKIAEGIKKAVHNSYCLNNNLNGWRVELYIDDGKLFVTGELSQGTITTYTLPYLGSVYFSNAFEEPVDLDEVDNTDYEQFIKDWITWYNDQSYPDEENKEFHRPLLDDYYDIGY